jgi:hypothetical protein
MVLPVGGIGVAVVREEGGVVPVGDVEVFPKGGKWHIRREGEETLPRAYTRQFEAVAEARARANRLGVELIIRDEDGTIAQRDSAGQDTRDGQR